MHKIKDLKIKKLFRIVDRVNSYSAKMASLSDEMLKKQTKVFKARLKNGENLDDLLPEAFAVVREADKRVLSMFPFDVQVLGGIVLHQGNIAEMKTGEGKTLTATMPVYLNALDGKGVILVTANSYLAERDAQEMGKVYRWLGLSISVGVDQKKEIKEKQKKTIYASDIVYTTSYALGFDYLIDNLSTFAEQKYMRAFNYVLIDEVDSVLLDSAQMPLVISGAPRVQSNLYQVSNNFILTLEKKVDFSLDDQEKNVWLTERGIDEAEHFFDIDNLFSEKYKELFKHIELALKAHQLFKINRDYVIEDQKVKLLDSVNGRIMEGTKLQSGLHQAIETKEHIEATPETRAMASITYQNLFRMFHKISGMTGTASTAKSEFLETYNMEVVSIPTNRPTIRKDLTDKIFVSLPEKISALIEQVKSLHEKGQPVLLVTESVSMSEIYSKILLEQGIAHNVLNAYNIPKEADIIAEAGQLGSFTVATSMAGRGTDIKLGPGVARLGGLAVIGSEHMKSNRIDEQLRGRAGRQGDPGLSQFYVSLEDNLLIKEGPDWIRKYFEKKSNKIDENEPKVLTRHKFTDLVKKIQKYKDEQSHDARIQSLEFDENLRIQREIVYKARNKIIFSKEILNQEIISLASKLFDIFLSNRKNLLFENLSRYILDNLNYDFKFDLPKNNDRKSIKKYLIKIVEDKIRDRQSILKNDQQLTNFEKISILKAIDSSWIEQVDNLQQIKLAVISRQYSQKNPLYEYQREASSSYGLMKKKIMLSGLKNFMLSDLVEGKNSEISIFFP
ncbi:accessory Sec system translocase SecA2 [Oenococcus oeni]|uniref:Protein translocase subunit SecA n=1 Tax=Oenococcus oeni TaxID=1247 RepID=A0A483BIZ5_OENOE|nr:accessory Sec system translocase SecA2 [Oenococcus oeni]MDV7714432.1 accessory Sec system translocase SecA2 [Oenococcus oeni]SYW05738.1 Protein translocase subunit SecA 2 [Oenococcus oeni]